MHPKQTCFFTCSWKSWVAQGGAVPALVKLGGTFTVVTESGTVQILDTTLQIIKLLFFYYFFIFPPLGESDPILQGCQRVSPPGDLGHRADSS